MASTRSSMATATATSVAAMLLLSLLLARARGADDYLGFVYAGCSQGRYASGTQYASDVDSVRAGGSGGVQAMSQCVEDLGAKACSVCVSAAAGQLKAGCGYATAGEVYLGKCYARFWGNGAGGFISGATGNAYGFGHHVSGNRFVLFVTGSFFTSLAYFTFVLM